LGVFYRNFVEVYRNFVEVYKNFVEVYRNLVEVYRTSVELYKNFVEVSRPLVEFYRTLIEYYGHSVEHRKTGEGLRNFPERSVKNGWRLYSSSGRSFFGVGEDPFGVCNAQIDGL
jgi:hypothetical protein